MENKYLFYHIPKTAGSSFTVLLKSIFGKEFIVNLNRLSGSNKDIVDAHKEDKVICGHFNNLGEVKNVFNDRFSIVFLREPVTRFISQYYHEIKVKMDNGEKVGEPNLYSYTKSLLKYSFFKAVNPTVNTQTCLLSNGDVTGAYRKFKQAKRNLAKFSFVGLTETADESIKLFLEKAKITTDEQLQEVNVGIYKHENSTNKILITLIRFLNRFDIKLYNYAVKLYEFQKHEIESL